mmetsp:Transcript_19345/g.56509  ORF Transcript_19345/g.56509 Transcript_19345/m.56509 type:complete len:385 (-) Transcript_19345:124-1278(-)
MPDTVHPRILQTGLPLCLYVLVNGLQSTLVVSQRVVEFLSFVTQHPHICPNLEGHCPPLPLHEPNGGPVPFQPLVVVRLALLQRQSLQLNQLGVQRVLIDRLLQVPERLPPILAGLYLHEAQRRQSVGGVGGAPQDEPQVGGRLLVLLVVYEALGQSKPRRAEVGGELARAVVEFGGRFHLVADMVDPGEEVERFGLDFLDGRAGVGSTGEHDDAVVVLLPQLEAGLRLALPSVLDPEPVFSLLLDHHRLESLPDPNPIARVNVHRLATLDDGASRRRLHGAGHRRPLPKVVVGEVILHHGVGPIDEVGRRDQPDAPLGPLPKVARRLVEAGHVQDCQPDHRLDVVPVHIQSALERRLGPVDLPQLVARQSEPHPGAPPRLLGE